MAKSRQELLDAIADSTPTGGGNNLRDGRYRLAVRKTGFGDGFNGARWDLDLVVVNCAKVAVAEVKTGKPLDIEPNGVGTDVGIVKMLTTDKPYPAPGLGDTKAFVLALFGVGEDIDKKELVQALDELDRTNSAYGMVIDCITRRKVSKANEVEMVLQDWHHVEQTADDIAKTRAWIESLITAAPAVVNQQQGIGPAMGPPRMGPPAA